jgi:hypothetical protein
VKTNIHYLVVLDGIYTFSLLKQNWTYPRVGVCVCVCVSGVPLDRFIEYSGQYNLNLAGMRMALKEQEIVCFAEKEEMSISARERLSLHEGAMSHVHRIFPVLIVNAYKMMTFFFVLCPVQCVHVPASYANLLPSFFRVTELVQA